MRAQMKLSELTVDVADVNIIAQRIAALSNDRPQSHIEVIPLRQDDAVVFAVYPKYRARAGVNNEPRAF